MIRICTTLVSLGHSVLLLGREKKDSKPLENHAFEQFRLPCVFQKGKLFYLEYQLRLWWFLAFSNPDLVYSVDLDSVMPAYFWRRIKTWKWFIDCHEWFPFVPEVERRKWVQRVWLWVENVSLKNADIVITVGEAIAEQLHQNYGINVHVLRNMPIKRAIPSHSNTTDWSLPTEPFILYQGAVNEGRGLERLVRIVSQLPYHLVIAGTGDLLEELKHEVTLRNAHDKIHFLGFVSPQVLPELTRRAHIGYNVSEPVSKSYELSLNNKFFDYVHAQLPSIINDFVEYRSLCSEFQVGLLVPNEDHAIVQALDQLMNQKEVYAHLQNQCKKAIEVWNWQNESQRLNFVFQT